MSPPALSCIPTVRIIVRELRVLQHYYEVGVLYRPFQNLPRLIIYGPITNQWLVNYRGCMSSCLILIEPYS
jgi:hypothetical protein